jgi:hypothetical protein
MPLITRIFRDLKVDRLPFRRVKPTVFATTEPSGSFRAASRGGLKTLDRLELRLVPFALSQQFPLHIPAGGLR